MCVSMYEYTYMLADLPRICMYLCMYVYTKLHSTNLSHSRARAPPSLLPLPHRPHDHLGTKNDLDSSRVRPLDLRRRLGLLGGAIK